jgi:hypothetical protein
LEGGGGDEYAVVIVLVVDDDEKGIVKVICLVLDTRQCHGRNVLVLAWWVVENDDGDGKAAMYEKAPNPTTAAGPPPRWRLLLATIKNRMEMYKKEKWQKQRRRK